MNTDMAGKYVIVRSSEAGVFAGILKEKDGQEVILNDCRRLWYWDGANSISQLANEGTAAPGECKFSVVVNEIWILSTIEIIPCTAEAEKCIREVAIWRRK